MKVKCDNCYSDFNPVDLIQVDNGKDYDYLCVDCFENPASVEDGKDHSACDPNVALWSAVVGRAIGDVCHKKPVIRQSAREFIMSEAFEDMWYVLCMNGRVPQIPVSSFRKKIMKIWNDKTNNGLDGKRLLSKIRAGVVLRYAKILGTFRSADMARMLGLDIEGYGILMARNYLKEYVDTGQIEITKSYSCLEDYGSGISLNLYRYIGG